MKVIFNQHVGIFENAISNEWCDEVIKIFNQNIELQKSRLESENAPIIYKADSTLGPDPMGKNIIEPFYKLLSNKILPTYNNKYAFEGNHHFNFVIRDFKTQKTLPSEGYHIWHFEDDSPSAKDRELVYSVYLNNVEEGGETEFLYQSLRIKPKRGTIVIWPAGFTHYHRGNPPLSGEKYITTGWITANPKNIKNLNK